MNSRRRGPWGHLGGWLQGLFIKNVGWGGGVGSGPAWGPDSFAAADSGEDTPSEQELESRGPTRRKWPTSYHRHHFRRSLETFGGNGSDNFGRVTPPVYLAVSLKLSI